MNKYAELVKEFNDTFCPEATTTIYKKLILEEFAEWWLEWASEDYKEEQELKELVDLMYVVYGYAHVKGLQLYVKNSELTKIARDIKPQYSHSLILGAYIEWLDSKDPEWLQNLSTACIAYANFRGWLLVEAFTRVHNSNMSKLGPDNKPIRRSDGKVEKGPNYMAPNLTNLIKKSNEKRKTTLLLPKM